ncbi:putative transposase IS891/IS1136/IS1341 family protein [Thermotoga sp. TBGT1765]|nr:putative transposase IS891/IS1136/IS1341 family protein [Thermotoga sp. Cell2]KHC93033.1 putative transposase IS891/IS1136/IS1341 family protein [Thermotoga sp. TBGT1765]KHC94441.1 putative transposase IS891/IS1136/IS1341 family protein [Thermotoga sp. TBGT1766]
MLKEYIKSQGRDKNASNLQVQNLPYERTRRKTGQTFRSHQIRVQLLSELRQHHLQSNGTSYILQRMGICFGKTQKDKQIFMAQRSELSSAPAVAERFRTCIQEFLQKASQLSKVQEKEILPPNLSYSTAHSAVYQRRQSKIRLYIRSQVQRRDKSAASQKASERRKDKTSNVHQNTNEQILRCDSL